MESGTVDNAVKILFEYGALGVLCAVFAGLIVWYVYYGTKHTNKVLEELNVQNKLNAQSQLHLAEAVSGIKQACENTATALNIVNNSMLTINQSFERHDKRVEFINNDVKEIVQSTRLIKKKPSREE
jgi:hypothetical protein